MLIYSPGLRDLGLQTHLDSGTPDSGTLGLWDLGLWDLGLKGIGELSKKWYRNSHKVIDIDIEIT